MEIIEFYKQDEEKRKNLIKQMEQTGWDAGDYLAEMLRDDTFHSNCGEQAETLVLMEGEQVASFCTYADFDEIESDTMKPWIGFVFTFPQFRGQRCAGKLIDYAINLAIKDGFKKIYVSSEETGLYEKYGFDFLEWQTSVHGYETKIFTKTLQQN